MVRLTNKCYNKGVRKMWNDYRVVIESRGKYHVEHKIFWYFWVPITYYSPVLQEDFPLKFPTRNDAEVWVFVRGGNIV